MTGFSESIRHIRQERGLTQEQFAEVVGVSTITVKFWETKRRLPDLDSFFKLTRRLGIRPEELGLQPSIDNP